MTEHIERRGVAAAQAGLRGGAAAPPSLLDLMDEGFYALYLVKQGSVPQDATTFADHMTGFLRDVDRLAKQAGVHVDDIDAARYAFCAAVDELVLRYAHNLRSAWQARPLQLLLFGDQLAGEHFFTKLAHLRTRGAAHLQALEVFHMCLLLGFQGRYAVDGHESLKFLSATLGDEIARMRGVSRPFAPNAERPDHIVNRLGRELSWWALTTMFLVAALAAYLGLRANLSHATATALSGHHQLVKLPQQAATVTITLP